MSSLQVVSYSELTTHKRCSFRHQIGYVERWSKRPAAMSALGKGSAWHTVMEAHYLEVQACQRSGVISTDEILARCKKKVAPVVADLDDELGDLIWWMYSGYVAYYGADPEWEILGVEHAAEVALPRPDGSDSEFRLKVKIDLVVREVQTRRIRIVDHKSGKDLPTRRALEVEDQFPLYHWAMQRLGKKVFGYTWNAARALKLKAEEKAPGSTPLDERFSREPMHRTDKEMQQIATEAYLSARATYREAADCKELGVDAPRTTDALRCFWDCDYFNACLAGRKGMDWRDMLHRAGFEQSFERHLQ